MLFVKVYKYHAKRDNYWKGIDISRKVWYNIIKEKHRPPKGKEEIMTITRCTINGKPTEIINTNSFVDNDGYVHIPADYDTFDEYFADWFDSLPEE